MSITLNFKTDKDLRDEAKKVASGLGLPLGTIMNHYLKEFVRDRKVIFTTHPTPTKKVVHELKEISKDIRDRKNLSPKFRNARDAVKWLRS
jgi:antitoxin component of RelBE/YafQ-DinJ toxin-antitoxin module